MPFLTLRLFVREMIRRLGKGAQVEEVYLAPFRGKDYRHKTVCHIGEAGVLRFCLQSLGDAGKEAILFRLKTDAASWQRLSSQISGYCRMFAPTGISPALTRCKWEENQEKSVLEISPRYFKLFLLSNLHFPGCFTLCISDSQWWTFTHSRRKINGFPSLPLFVRLYARDTAPSFYYAFWSPQSNLFSPWQNCIILANLIWITFMHFGQNKPHYLLFLTHSSKTRSNSSSLSPAVGVHRASPAVPNAERVHGTHTGTNQPRASWQGIGEEEPLSLPSHVRHHLLHCTACAGQEIV